MANELKHGDQGVTLTKAEFEGVGLHVFNSQATGDIVYASSSSQLSRLAAGSTNDVLRITGGIPDWQATSFITSLGTIATGVWQGTDVGVEYGGTGVSTLTDGGVLLGSGEGAITAMAVLADSEMIVGDGTTDPVAESGATLRTSIGVGTGDTPQFTGINVGHASDSTITRGAAGLLDVEGVRLVTVSATQTLTNKTLTTPTIGSFANAEHDHTDSAGGGTVAIPAQANAAAITAATNQDTYIPPDLAVHLRGLAKTWGLIYGAGGISIGAQNVASITDSGTGDRTLNFTVDYDDGYYVYGSLPIDTPANPPPFVGYANVAVGSIDLNCSDASGPEDFGHNFYAWGNF